MGQVLFLVGGSLLWTIAFLLHSTAGSSPRELFILNLEDGYFGCQVNESTEFLQIFQLSKLCDGVPNCFLGSDELEGELKCSADCSNPACKDCPSPARCVNGVCLDKQCHCNDGFGGKGCDLPDENECKYRPCDVFARCTNTLGSFYCTCFPGYEGNGFECKDINECENPALAAKCVRNAECCNLPAHYVCKCRPGFEGDGYTECKDIDECLQPNICAKGAVCTNYEGNFTCTSPEGYTGDPYIEIYDIDECQNPKICGLGASCINTEGSYRCECLLGFERDPVHGCVDVDECQRGISPCGVNGICLNTLGSFECSCPAGYVYSFQHGCQDIDECLEQPCGSGSECENLPGSFECKCPPGFNGNAKVACSRVSVEIRCSSNQDCVPNAQCFDGMCACAEGFHETNMECIDINECSKPNICGPNAKCINIPSSYECQCNPGFAGKPPRDPCKDQDECMDGRFPCGRNAKCTNNVGSFVCSCPKPLMGDPYRECRSPCENIYCGPHAKCRPDGQSAICLCDEGFTFDPRNVSAMCLDINECDSNGLGPSGLCGENAICTNNPGSFSCVCPPGYQGNAFTRCDDIDECLIQKACGKDAVCRNTIGSYVCECPADKLGDPYVECIGPKQIPCDIANNNSCPGNSFCSPITHVCDCRPPNIGDDCRHPCDSLFCGLNTECMLINEKPMCVCKHGYTGSSVDPSGCIDLNECSGNRSPCGQNAVCRNLPGSFTCECPASFEGNPLQGCIKSEGKIDQDCLKADICNSNEECVKEGNKHVCVCKQGFVRDVKNHNCRDINECTEITDKPVCGLNAICHNVIGSYECSCAALFTGNPFMHCVPIDIECSKDTDCPGNTICLNGKGLNSRYCGCALPYIRQGQYCVSMNYNCSTTTPCPHNLQCALLSGGQGYCVCPRGYTVDSTGGCSTDIDECTELKQHFLCGRNAQCVNKPGGYECRCQPGFTGDPSKECSLLVTKCTSRKECAANEVCASPGECQCLPPFIKDGASCKHPCEFMRCGVYSECVLTNQGGQCQCKKGFDGNPQVECYDINECANPRLQTCGHNSLCINTLGNFSCECPTGMEGNPYSREGCKKLHDVAGCKSSSECPANTVCINKQCVDPCISIQCGRHASCIRTQTGAECSCNLGYEPNDNKQQCISKCNNYLCAKNAQCIIDNSGTPTCLCLPGYQGLPHAGGECRLEQCSRKEDCEKPQECLQGQCKERCQGIVCGMGARCDRVANRCECWPLFIGNPELLCVPPIMPPVCAPSCGKNAYCEYGLPNKCVCKPGLTGNPYDFCEAAPRRCDEVRCGENANCVQGNSRVDCICPPGFEGSPYLGCKDVNECLYGTICGVNAICINTFGSYECRCKAGFFGDPYANCIPEQGPVTPSPIDRGDCTIPHAGCKCSSSADCNNRDMICHHLQGVCVTNPCSDHTCGPNAFCETVRDEPVCKCLSNFPHGDPTDIKKGCSGDVCQNDLSCSALEVCLRNNFGFRECIAVCKITQCGPNAYCQAKDHHGECFCSAGFPYGDPYDLVNGCSPVLPDECEQDSSCPDDTVCLRSSAGHLACLDPCTSESIACGSGARCTAENKRAVCSCLDGYFGDPNDPVEGCIPKPPPECERDNDCLQFEHQCRVDHTGVKKCISPCIEFSCELKNAECIVVNRKAECQCKAGFTGRPNSREGCKKITHHECSTNDDCDPDRLCQRDKDGIVKCLEVCKLYTCGMNAVCVPKNHAHTCQCPPGLYIPDPNYPTGCKRVQCLTSNNCSENEVCTNYKCEDPCKSACGSNAVCIVQDHRAVCSCKAGFTGNPTVECRSINFCDSNPCHPSAQCHATPGSYICRCPDNLIGNPYIEKCHRPGMCPNGDSDCEMTDKCHIDPHGVAKCINPCEGHCGPNAHCITRNHHPSCRCQPNFLPSPTPREGCVRKTSLCTTDHQCGPGHLCVEGECQYVCSNDGDCAKGEKCFNSICVVFCINNNQCPSGQVCLQGVCLTGCRSNSDCSNPKESCIDYKCRNPCSSAGICGQNALCDVIGHQVQCSCPPSFAPNPTPVQGCVRIFRTCGPHAPCAPGFDCYKGACLQSCNAADKCGFGERCANDRCEVLCTNDKNCQPGQVCMDQHCQAGCRTDGDCRSNEYCLKNQCFCQRGFILGPGGCEDENECQKNPCHSSAKCINTPGSYLCQCAQGEYGEPYREGCRKDACQRDQDCPKTAVCSKDNSGTMNCIDPCVGVTCALHAVCVVIEHQPYCECPQGFLGDPIDHEIGCYMPECVDNSKCSDDKECFQYKCENPCDAIDCGENGVCVAKNHRGFCKCNEGFTPSDKGYCVDEDECKTLKNPCPSPSKCINFPGGYSCQCPAGFHEEYVNQKILCQPNGECPHGDVDCPISLTCTNVSGITKCVDPCEKSICGIKAQCRVVERRAICYCPARFTGDPGKECFPVECLNSQECDETKACVTYVCKDPCKVAGACGVNAECTTANHVAICRCKEGYDGNAEIGCKLRIPCESDDVCSYGETCQNKFCRVPCDTNRACLSNEQCINGKCTAICSRDNDCPTDKFCEKNICKQRLKCRTDNDCEDGLMCLPNARNQPDCLNPCEGVICDGRNSECVVQDRLGICVCKKGYAGKPDDIYVGCVKIDCEDNSKCTPDKVCIDYKCQNPCTQPGVKCGANAVCYAAKHTPVCKCRDGFEGDPLSGCKAIDFCKNNPCGERAACRNVPGNFECVCLEGTVLDPKSGQCRGPNDCPNGDSDCSENTKCITVGSGVPTCRDPCLDAICGFNTICLVEHHRPMCRCMLGFDGNPLNGCRRMVVPCINNADCSPGLICDNRACVASCSIDRDCASQERCSINRCGVECSRDDDCPESEICLENICQLACRKDDDCAIQEACVTGQCRNLCESKTTCGINAQCQMVTHQKQCSCPHGFEGDANVECRRVPLPCRVTDDCPRGQLCNNGRCRSQCTTDNDCFLSEKCLEQRCIQTCKSDTDCTNSEICQKGICYVGCRKNSHCSTSHACIEHQCRDLCEGKASCGPNAHCEMVNHRPSCTCPDTFVPYPIPNSGCIRDHPTCINGNGCAPGFACMDTQCIPICSSDHDCGDNEKCMDGRCLIACRRDNNCPEGEICDGLTCIPGCRNDDECSTNEACINNHCRDPCGAPAACGTNGQCRVENHQVVCSCLEGMTGNANVACVRIIPSCNKNDDCGPNSQCHYGSCIAECTNDAHCLNNERCLTSLCIPVCTNDRNCPKTYTCLNGFCQDPCSNPSVCGVNAQCKVMNRQIACSCPAGMTGNPRVQCIRVPDRCNANRDCQPGWICQDKYCTPRCSSDKECLQGETCRNKMCRVTCGSFCPPDHVCVGGVCIPGCADNNDCPLTRKCMQNQCQDPCQAQPSPCGVNAECKAGNHNAMCMCPNGYAGEPTKHCEKVGCNRNEECDSNKACINNVCQVPCLVPGACGRKAQCRVENRQKVCSCPLDFTGDPFIECYQVHRCDLSEFCPGNLVCLPGNECGCSHSLRRISDACIGFHNQTCSLNKPCPVNQKCRLDLGICICPRGFTFNPAGDCVDMDECAQIPCGPNAHCANSLGSYTCTCHPGHYGDPYSTYGCANMSADVSRCQKNDDCLHKEICVNGQCMQQSFCEDGVSCSLSCRKVEDCPEDSLCEKGFCINPCFADNPCAPGAICRMENHSPICVCPPGYEGIAQKNCFVTVSPPPVTPFTQKPVCLRDSDCPFSQACLQEVCQDPCAWFKPCGLNAECKVNTHRAVCSCVAGYEGDPQTNCYKVTPPPLPPPICIRDSDCSVDKACIQEDCRNPCDWYKPCGVNTLCKVQSHRSVCSCLVGYEGNPLVGCAQVTPRPPVCVRDEDCAFDKACIREDCRNPCEWYSACGDNTQCKVVAHQAVCNCLEGFEGNPLFGCKQVIPKTPPICERDTDCPADAACIKEDCRNPCDWYKPCGANALCKVNVHRAVCFCQSGFEGNPSVACLKVTTPSPVCVRDSDCAYDKACIKEDCRNPCDWYKPCGQNAQCKVNTHRAVCTCMHGYEGNPLLTCQQVTTPKPVCVKDSDCPQDKACIKNDCRNPCDWHKPCGQNTQCRVTTHRAVCSCLPGYDGNPLVSCLKVTTPPAICTRDSDCAFDKACIKDDCRNPCDWYKPCGQNAQCKANTHRAVCSCIQGYEGNPLLLCSRVTVPPPSPTPPPPICSKDSDCPFDKACIQDDCRDPCLWNRPCGQNTQCQTLSHRAVCMCKTGFVGNPSIGCLQVTTPQPICTKDNDCSYDKACIKNDCRNPCTWYKPCGQNAICKSTMHQAVCHCPSGFEGNPLISCLQVTTKSPICVRDSDCSYDKACIKDDCRNPCDWYKPCGHNAQCKVNTHRAVCMCFPNYEGNPSIACYPVTAPPPTKPQPVCVRDADCPFDRGCIKDDCRDPCQWYKPCGENAMCKAISHKPVCNCNIGYEGNGYLACWKVVTPSPRPICVRDPDCPFDKACIKDDCRNPCDWYKPCGINAECKIADHRAICSCFPGFEGNPLVSCQKVTTPSPICVRDSDCSYDKACIKDDCRNPCDWYKPCGQNAQCKVNTHRAVCNCLPGFEGNPLVLCSKVTTPTPVCVKDSDCSYDKACIKEDCRNPCHWYKPCAQNAQCKVDSHRAVCICLPGYEGNPLVSCDKVTTKKPVICERDSDCAFDKSCIKDDCRNPCDWYKPCGENALCKANMHQAMCHCPEGYDGNPLVACRQIPPSPRPVCIKDSDCSSDKACIKADCRNPCTWYKPCGFNAECRVNAHRAICLCLPGYEGNPLVQCSPVVTTQEPVCRRDSDCPVSMACIQKDCRNPCTHSGICGTNALCRVIIHQVFCYCPPNYSGNPHISCSLEGCQSNDECPLDRICRNRQCVDPCLHGAYPCGVNANCRAVNHAVLCNCLPDFTGDPLIECRRVVAIEPQCRRHSDCPHDKACISGTCRNPCTEVPKNPCGVNAFCNVRSHRPICSCPQHYTGDPLIRCIKSGCTSNNECPLHLACIDTRCQNPCSVFTSTCGRHAECFVDFHEPRCRCPAGLRGNPHIECVFIECSRDEECPIGKSCIQERCQNPCETQHICAPSAQCLVPLHSVLCVCPEGSFGDPYQQCNIRRKDECYTDGDCANDYACIEEKCQIPCPLLNPCGTLSQCKVINSIPWRTLTCTCPPGFISDNNRGCIEVPKPKPECTNDQECPRDKACENNRCRLVCSVSDLCGINARCESVNHRPSCSCLPGYIGDPHRECQPAGCQGNNDCAFDKACVQRECVDPCYVKNRCHPTAGCKSINHEAQCFCPSGMKGDPTVGCVAVECFTSQDCPVDRGCFNNVCENPCRLNNQCGRNAECEPRDHVAVCICPKHMEGNPLIECRSKAPPPQCITDADCPSQMACISERCQNPCPVLQPCQNGAECKVIDSVPWRTLLCVCPNGFVATPNRGCQQLAIDREDVECQSDAHCPNNLACDANHCIDPCITRNPCASNGQCSVRNHRPICSCQDGYYGDPKGTCIRLECTSNDDCTDDKTCHQNQCINPCLLDNPCGQNAACRPKNHASNCECQRGFNGNPLVTCVRIECQSDADCPSDRVCSQEFCRNPCESYQCGLRALCTVNNHQPSCVCPPGFTGNAHHECTIIIKVECITDADCPSTQACINEKCQNPCHVLRPCHASSDCKVLDTVPWRTMLCVCPSGFIATTNRGCEKIKVPGACKSDNDCDIAKACIDGICDDPCRRLNECGFNAICTVTNHRGICSCPLNTIGNPHAKCINVECQQDDECSSDKACRTNHCINLCSFNNPCGHNAECKMINHKQSCQCISGFQGDPLRKCEYVECRSDAECPADRTCFNNRCSDPCIITPCSAREMICKAVNHQAECSCPPGFKNEQVACKKVDLEIYECVTDADCPSGLACLNRECQNPCLVLHPCGYLSECKVIDSVPWRTIMCICPENYMGDQNRGCIEVPRPPPEPKGCQSDSECNRGLACLQNDCQDPCQYEVSCAEHAICQVPFHRPVCSCPTRFYGDAQIKCERIECNSDDECPADKACREYQCIDLCLVISPCGTNAECKVVRHRQMCECSKGYHGDPYKYCKPVECQRNEDCADTRICVDDTCQNPCSINKCGTNAICEPRSHAAICTCPPGFIGNAVQECTVQDTSCKTDADCPSQLACMDRVCQNPCLALHPCGHFAECKVIDTVPWRSMVCVCPNGYVGDLQRGCTKVPVDDRCKSNNDCPDYQACISRQCQDPCAFTTCGIGAVCHSSQHRAVCNCLPQFIGDPKIECVRVECRSDNDCPFDKSCLNDKCIDICLFKNPCASSAKCRMNQHSPICYCPVGMQGDPHIGCSEVECSSHVECPDDRACVNQRCIDLCTTPGHSSCTSNSVCFMSNHAANCKCPDGFSGNPSVLCSKEDITCITDSDCPSGLACINQLCVNPCLEISPCGPQAECKVVDTVPWRSMICHCPNGYMTDNQKGCIRVDVEIHVTPSCRQDTDCPNDKACINYNCESVCLIGRPCGDNAICKAVNHRSVCVCIDGYVGRPEIACVHGSCTNDLYCPDSSHCVGQICQDVCASNPCHINANCFGEEHTVRCICKPGYEGDGFSSCIAITCHSDDQCADTEVCIIGQCRNPCDTHVCGRNAICIPTNHHQARCHCVPPFYGDGNTGCTERVFINVTCTDDSCPDKMACIDTSCKDPCKENNPCGINAKCEVINSRPVVTLVCLCLPGFIGDATHECRPAPLDKSTCVSDDSCISQEACFSGRCQNPCLVSKPCAPNALCLSVNHHPLCICPHGYTGQPNTLCHKIDCQNDDDCPSVMACINQNCTDTCNTTTADKCPVNSICQVTNHIATCKCLPQFAGDPSRACEPIVCNFHEDCPDNMLCENRHCTSGCKDTTCAANADCTTKNHQVKCECIKGFVGNGIHHCEKKKALCLLDEDCPSEEACINSTCQNACEILKPCGISTKCSVHNTKPAVTFSCYCREGYAGDPASICYPEDLHKQCVSDNDCDDTTACVENKCQNPCKFTTCGRASLCRANYHRAVCICPNGYVGTADEECFLYGCESDSDCPSDRTCFRNKCISPCSLTVFCGRNAECHAENHKPFCKCIDGFEGDPLASCIVKSCSVDTDCPSNKKCMIGQCQNPCTGACGREAECLVERHQAKCFCKRGYTGNPWVHCLPFVGSCQKDDDCPEETICLDGECQNACAVLHPCSPGAMCKTTKSRHLTVMTCDCTNGYIGDALIGCQKISTKVHCSADLDCSAEEACVKGNCVNPCSSCGLNTLCTIFNHRPICTCPVGYTGNANKFCYKIICSSNDDCYDNHICHEGKCTDGCSLNNITCPPEAECTTVLHKSTCKCLKGFTVDNFQCSKIRCHSSNSSCPNNQFCQKDDCLDPCAFSSCASNSECLTSNHEAFCKCLPGFTGDPYRTCMIIAKEDLCQDDSSCSLDKACVNGKCTDVCREFSPCGKNSQCFLSNILPIAALSCSCLEGYEGNPLVECREIVANLSQCSTDADCTENKACIENFCQDLCPVSNLCGKNALCVMLGHRPECYCPPPLTGNAYAECLPIPTCTDHSQCSGNLICLTNGECGCYPHMIQLGEYCIVEISRNCTTTDECPEHEECQPLIRRCICPKDKTLLPNGICTPSPLSPKTNVPFTEYPPTGSVVVNCRGDGIHVDVPIKSSFDGVVYVKGFSKDEHCRKVMSTLQSPGTLPFVVRFNTCGLVPIGGIASFILVIQKHPKLVTHKARAYDVKCIYQTGEIPVTLSLNVSMITTSGTIANTGPPPTCVMRICNSDGEDISTAEIGETLMLKLEVTPKNVYSGFARSCYALPMEDGKDNYPVTDENGCAHDPSVFGEWQYDEQKHVLLATFNAFKFPNGNTIRFQCDVKVCFGQCQPVNCHGVDAYGRRKRQARKGIEKDVGDDPSLKNRGTADEYTNIGMTSNAIHIVDKKDSAAQQNHTANEQIQRKDEVCVSTTGLIIALVITALLALVAIAVAVSCWLMAYRRRPKAEGPLPHPPDFPNPLYTTPEPIMEPSPDYLS